MAVRITRAGVALTVGIILVTGLIIGGFFWARQSSEQARRTEAIKIAEQNLEGLANQETALNEGEENDNSGEGATNTEENTANESTNEPSATEEATDPSRETSEVNELPETGIADVSALIVIGLVTFAGVSYYQSRRALI